LQKLKQIAEHEDKSKGHAPWALSNQPFHANSMVGRVLHLYLEVRMGPGTRQIWVLT
jgi:hypothetical protein